MNDSIRTCHCFPNGQTIEEITLEPFDVLKKPISVSGIPGEDLFDGKKIGVFPFQGTNPCYTFGQIVKQMCAQHAGTSSKKYHNDGYFLGMTVLSSCLQRIFSISFNFWWDA